MAGIGRTLGVIAIEMIAADVLDVLHSLRLELGIDLREGLVIIGVMLVARWKNP